MKKYNNEEFARLTKVAMGKTHNVASFAKNIQINKKYLEKIMNGTPQSPPSLSVIQRIANESEGRVDGAELFIAAGYQESLPVPKIDQADIECKAGKTSSTLYKLENDFLKKGADDCRQQIEQMRQRNEFLKSVEHLDKADAAARNEISNQLIQSSAFGAKQPHIHFNKDVHPTPITIPEKFLKERDKGESEITSTSKNKSEKLYVHESHIAKATPKKYIETENPITTEIDEIAGKAQIFKGANSMSFQTEIFIEDVAELAVYRYIRDQYCQKKGISMELRPSSIVKTLCFGYKGQNVIFDISLLKDKRVMMDDLYRVYGKISVMDSEINKEVYIVVSNKKTAAFIRRNPQRNIANIQINVLYLEGIKLIKE